MNEYALIISIAGALVSFFAMLCVAIIGFLVKYVLTSVDRRLVHLENKTESHSAHVATAQTQTVAEAKAFVELREDISNMQSRFDNRFSELSTQISSLTSRTRTRTR